MKNNKGGLFLAVYFLAIFIPGVVSRVAGTEQFRGYVANLHVGKDRRVGTYYLPGILYPPEHIIKGWLSPEKYDLNMVHYGHKDYQPTLAAKAVAAHIKEKGYDEVQIVACSMGDQLLKTIGEELPEMVDEHRLHVVILDPEISPNTLSEKFQETLRIGNPILGTLRTLLGWIAEIPLFKRDDCWRSFAEVADPLDSLMTYEYDYINEPIFGCIEGVAVDGDVFYYREDIDNYFQSIFTFEDDDNSVETRLYFNPEGELANIRDKKTVLGYDRMFEDIEWQF